MSTTLRTATERICNRCGELKPIEQFTRYRKGEERRREICTPCRWLDQKARDARGRMRLFGKDITRLSEVKGDEQLRALVEALTARWGGLHAFAERFHKWMEASPAGSARRLRGYRLIMKAIASADRIREEEQRLENEAKILETRRALKAVGHTDDHFRQAIAELCVVSPEVVRQGLADAGWRVT